MKAKIRLSILLICIALLISAAAFADCEFTFNANGRTYHVTHVPSDFEWYMMPHQGEPEYDFLNPSKEYIEFNNAYKAAISQHRATCPYQNNLGDERIPMPLIYGGAALAAVAILVVHTKRKALRAVN